MKTPKKYYFGRIFCLILNVSIGNFFLGYKFAIINTIQNNLNKINDWKTSRNFYIGFITSFLASMEIFIHY